MCEAIGVRLRAAQHQQCPSCYLPGARRPDTCMTPRKCVLQDLKHLQGTFTALSLLITSQLTGDKQAQICLI